MEIANETPVAPVPALRPPEKAVSLRLPDTLIAALSLISICLHLYLRFVVHSGDLIAEFPLLLVLIVGGLPLVVSLVRDLLRGRFGSDLLAGVSIITSAILGEYLVGTIVVLMLAGGTALESYATRKASSVLDALAKRMPQIAHREKDGAFADVELSKVNIGDDLIVFPHENCPVDGVVTGGNGMMDESYLTGEPFLMAKGPGSTVLSGSINGETALKIRTQKMAVDSRYAKIMQVMQDSERNRPQIRRIGDTLGAWYTPIAVSVALITWFVSHDPLRFLAVVVVATPCPLLIAIPVAVIGGISLAAKQGIIIKDPGILERITTCRTLIFDKTGTLTMGRPRLDEICCADAFSRAEVLAAAASLERYSKHPLASAILEEAERAGPGLKNAENISEIPGQGLTGNIGGRRITIRGREKNDELSFAAKKSGLECVLLIDDAPSGVFRFHDTPRAESKPFVGHLRPMHQIDRVLLVSGDHPDEVNYLAGLVGITEIHADKSPEEKVAIVKAEMKRQRTAFVGDGINDAPALLSATAGIAFGANSDVTTEAAGAVILSASIAKVDELMHIGGRMRSIALQSALGGMALSVGGMIAAAFGYLPPLEGAIFQEVIDVVAVLNALRTAIPMRRLSDF